MSSKTKWIALTIISFALIFWLISTCAGDIEEAVKGWWRSIHDPTERGCAYIATAIAAHAMITALKTFSSTVKIEK